MRQKNPQRVIVLGNEKGGTGKSTTAMHLIVSLLQDGYSVGTMDLDRRQGSLLRYLETRRSMIQTLIDQGNSAQLLMPEEVTLETNELSEFDAALEYLLGNNDLVVIDCPGNDTPISRHAHIAADMLITPLNESFVDFAVLADIDPLTLKVGVPSHYSEMVWQQRQERALHQRAPLDWVVLCNRVTNLKGSSNNKEKFHAALTALSKKTDFRIVSGFSERVLFRELYPQGLTLLDLKQLGLSAMNELAAKQELRNMVRGLDIKIVPLHQQQNYEVSDQEQQFNSKIAASA